MKLFKKVLAVALVGAMAVSMLTACGDSSKTADVKKALKDVGVTTTKTMNKETNKVMNEMQSAAVKVAALDTSDTAAVGKFVAEEQEKLRGMTQYTFSNAAGNGSYDLYIWTNGADKRPGVGTGKYPYLRKVDYANHVNEPKTLAALFSKQFVEKGVFSGSDESMEALQSVLKAATKDGKPVENLKVGISCQKVYGYDVLLVTVPSDIVLSQDGADKTVK